MVLEVLPAEIPMLFQIPELFELRGCQRKLNPVWRHREWSWFNPVEDMLKLRFPFGKTQSNGMSFIQRCIRSVCG